MDVGELNWHVCQPWRIYLITFAFVRWLLYVQLHQRVFDMWSISRVRGMKPVLKIKLIKHDSANKHLSSLCVFLCIYMLWDASYGRWGRFPYPFNTVKAGAQRPVEVPKLELLGSPTLPWLLCALPQRTLLQPVVVSEGRIKIKNTGTNDKCTHTPVPSTNSHLFSLLHTHMLTERGRYNK